MKLLWRIPDGLPFFEGETKYPKYFIAIKSNKENVLNHLQTYTPFLPPSRRFYADPVLFKYQGTNYLFFEDYDYQKGVISCVMIDKNMKVSEPVKVLDKLIHLSFPYVFEDNGEIYMTPETYDYKAVFLFRAKKFPLEWEPCRFLVRGEQFSDPILFKHNGYYWLFAAVRGDRLAIYYAKDLMGVFTPHPINRRSIRGRNAGPVFLDQKRLIRPTMDCIESYGRSMLLKEIVLLDPNRFVEKELSRIEPTWAPGLDGTHTYCQNEDYVVYDGHRNICAAEDASYSW